MACRHFVVERFTSAAEHADSVYAPGLAADFEVLIFLEGAGEIIVRDEHYTYAGEQMWQLPKNVGGYRVVPGRATTWLKVSVPAGLAAVRDRLSRAGVAKSEIDRVVIEDV